MLWVILWAGNKFIHFYLELDFAYMNKLLEKIQNVGIKNCMFLIPYNLGNPDQTVMPAMIDPEYHTSMDQDFNITKTYTDGVKIRLKFTNPIYPGQREYYIHDLHSLIEDGENYHFYVKG